MTAEIVYKGALRCEATHLQSSTLIETDAPSDNKGKGEKFSPSDLLAAALGTCIITTIGIKTETWEVNLTHTRLEVTKIISGDPRRVGEIKVDIYLPATVHLDEQQKRLLEKIAETCPVAKSLHPDLKQTVLFHW